MKKILLIGAAISSSMLAFCAEHTITNSGFTFSPASLTIADGDVVTFSIASQHNVREVDEATWNANGNTALTGGFSTPNGGGQITPSVGVHYYVCVPHASMGMKGMITVMDVSGLNKLFANEINLFPNPATDVVNILVPEGEQLDYVLSSITGQTVAKAEDLPGGVIHAIPVAELPRGMYVLTVTNGVAEYRKTLSIK